MRPLGMCLFVALAVAASARVGALRTLDGAAVQGHVRVTPDRIVVVNADTALLFATPLTNVAELIFPTNAVARDLLVRVEGTPAGWQQTGIGAIAPAGSVRHAPGEFTVRGAGEGIGGTADSFHFAFKPVHGDSEIVADVSVIQQTHPDAQAGLMMREHLTAYSRYVMLSLTALRGGALQFRASDHATAEVVRQPTLRPPHWLKLRRRGHEFTAYASENGRFWSLVEKVSVPMDTNIHVGLAVASARSGVLNWTTFRHVREAPKIVNEHFTPQVELTSGSVIAGRPAYVDEEEVLFGGAPRTLRLPTSRVARIAFQRLSGDLAWKTRASRPGVWVSNGDFIDGDLHTIDGSKLTLNSVLFGPRTFDVDDEVLALVLQPRRVRPAKFELHTRDGSVLLASDVQLGDGEFRVRETALGDVRVPAFEILELRRR